MENLEMLNLETISNMSDEVIEIQLRKCRRILVNTCSLGERDANTLMTNIIKLSQAIKK